MRRVPWLLALLLLPLTGAYGIVTPDAPSSSSPTDDSEASPTDPAPSPDLETSPAADGATSQSESQPVKDSIPASPQRIAEPDEPKADAVLADEDVDLLDLSAGGLFEVVDGDSVDAGKRQNYASLDAGAIILDAAADTKSPTNLLVPDKDRYMLTPCANPRKWVVISLSEDVHADAIAVANYEKFSSPVKDFIVLGSVNYPTDTWLVLGNFTAAHTNGEQIFQLDAQQHVRYIKFRFLSHYGSEYYCTMSQLRVFGRTFTQVISQLEKSIDAEVEVLDAQSPLSVPQLSSLSDTAEISVPRIPDPTELVSQCLMEKNNTIVAVFYDKAQQSQHYQSRGMCCLVDYTPEQIEAEAAASLNSKEELPSTSSTDLIDPDVGDGAANQESLNDQLVEIRSMIIELKDHMAKELSSNEQTLQNYGRLFNDVRRDNIALWNEMLIVREVITTMKAGILCAIILSGFIIMFYLLRLLFRCVSKCKDRADLREWFWRMENHESSSADIDEKMFIGNVAAGALRVNRKAQFGSSWDDSAIERKTLQVFGFLEDDDLRPSSPVVARTTIQNLEQKLTAAEQSSDLFAQQLANAKERFQTKLLAREEEISLEKVVLVKEKESQLQLQQARFTTEAELWKREIASLSKVKLELQAESDRLRKEVNDTVLQRGVAEAQHCAFEAEHDRTNRELHMLLQEREQFEYAQIEILKLRSKIVDDSQRHEIQHQQLEERVNILLLEKEDQLVIFDRKLQQCHRQHQDEKSKLLRFAQEVRGLHRLLQLSVIEAREHINNEVKTTKNALDAIHQQASELAVHQSDRDMALVSRKGRILQLETQLKNDRQTINQLEATLTKSTRLLEKKNAMLKAKFEEQKEHLEITLAVRQGLTNDLQIKRTQVTELEREIARLNLAKSKADVKAKHAQQQVLAMQKIHVRGMERHSKKAAPSLTFGDKGLQTTDPVLEENNENKYLAQGSPEEPGETEWLEFVELMAAYEAERQLHA
ncbi:hypothetical protein JM18_001416 [Phytophthora kernoviae]|uniref:SUN domain-containing protein n=1 Tax=Phytophthora kernoviae TaxID=325452 RepID=A0A921VES1_9STRA|nr:hypothetical protein JM18_001416 [Phytophthora kernoviae]